MSGLDANGNGELDELDVGDPSYVCNGAPGQDGAPGADGGQGADGAAGAQGRKALIEVLDEPAGDKCPHGGEAVITGLDSNGNNLLDGEEAQEPVYICDGAPGMNGEQGTTGVSGMDGAAGADGSDGSSCSVQTSSFNVTRVSCSDGTVSVVNGVALAPVAVTTSSVSDSWVGEGALTPDFAGWMSAVDSGQPEWIQYDFGDGALVLPTFIQGYFVNGRDGSPVFQGSKDGQEWTDLVTYSWSNFQFGAGPLGSSGCGYYSQAIPAPIDEGYRYVRAYSAGAPYLFYNWLQITGVKLQ